MNYIIFDLEATCWQVKSKENTNEIIEIGAICIDQNLVIKNEFSKFVRPILTNKLSDFCKELTSIKQIDIAQADSFGKVIEEFKKWIRQDEQEYVLCSWGFYDKTQLGKDCKLHGLESDWIKKHISIKHQFAKFKNSKPLGMAAALKMENLVLEGTHHRGIDDARNIAKLFLKNFASFEFPKV